MSRLHHTFFAIAFFLVGAICVHIHFGILSIQILANSIPWNNWLNGLVICAFLGCG